MSNISKKPKIIKTNLIKKKKKKIKKLLKL